MKTFVLNGWAASPRAWDLCTFRRDALFSASDHLDGATERAFDGAAESVLLVGWSMGGTESLRLVARNPRKVAGLVLLAATPRMMRDDGWDGMTERRLVALEAGLRLTMGRGLDARPGVPCPYEMDDDATLARGLDYLRATDLRPALEASRDALAGIPAVLFQADRDPIVRAGNAAYLASLFPGAEVNRIPGAEHALPVLVPELIDAAVARLV